MKFKHQIYVGTAIMAILPVISGAIFATLVSREGQSAMQEQVRQQLISIRESKKLEIEDNFDLIGNRLRAQSIQLDSQRESVYRGENLRRMAYSSRFSLLGNHL